MRILQEDDRLARRRDEILDEATKLFAAEGYTGARVDDLATRLGVAKGTIYRYFPTKENLFLSAADKAMDDLQACIRRAVEAYDDPLDRIRAGVEAHLGFFDDHRSFVEVFAHERAEFHDRRTSNFLKFREKTRKRLDGALAELQGRGIVRRIDEAAAAELLSDLLFGVIHMQFIKRGNTPLKKQAPFIIDLFFRGILTDSGRKTWQEKCN